MAFDYVSDDVIPCLGPSPIDLAAYRDVVLDRFGNPAIRDTNQRVAADGFSKIRASSHRPCASGWTRANSHRQRGDAAALFLAFLQRWHRGAFAYACQDQGMDELVAHAICDAADPVVALCADAGPVGARSRAMRGWSMRCAARAARCRGPS